LPREDWDRIQEIFLEAVDLPPAERAAFLDRACNSNAEVRGEVESLLRADGTNEAVVFAAIESEAASMLDEPSLVGARLGPYRVLREIGRGGMGAVYLAQRDDEHYRKLVALKVVQRGLDTAGVLARFRHERQILAGFEHPYIARLIDGGTTPDGRPFLVMEYVKGHPIVAYCRERNSDLESRLRLFLRVCEAVSYAHRALVVHRDLKPNNILVSGEGIPKLLDFGVAKLLDPGADPRLTSTSFAMVPLTPAYASPEQVRGLSISPVVDVYALGAILFELLTGTCAQKINTHTPSEIERVVCQTEVQRPSVAARAAGLPRWRGDLDDIILMAMRKESERRYQSVDQLADDIVRYLDGRSVRARQSSFGYRTQKFVGRQRSLILAITVCLIALPLAYRFRPAMPSPQVSRIVQLTKTGGAMQEQPLYTDGSRVYYESIDEKTAEWQLRQVLLNGNEVTSVDIPSRFSVRGLSPDDTEFLAIDPNAEAWTVWTIAVTGGSPRRIGNLRAYDIAWSHNGNWFAYSLGNQLLLAKADGTSSHPLVTVPTGSKWIYHPRWSPDDTRLRFTEFTWSGRTHTLWEIEADGSNLHQLRFHWQGDEQECCGEWTSDGRYFLFTSSREGISNLWALEENSDWWRRATRDPVQLTSGPMSYYQLIPSRNGKHIYAIGAQPSGELVRYDGGRKDFVPFLGGRSADHVVFSRDGQWLAYLDFPDGSLWRARSDGTEELQLTFPPLKAIYPRWSPDGKRIAFQGKQPGQFYRNFAISAEGGNPEPFPSEALSQSSPDWMPSGDALIYSRVYGAGDPGLYRFDLRTGQSEKIPGSDGLYGPRWSPDGRYLSAIEAANDLLLLVDLRTGKRTPLVRPARWPCWSADSQYLYFNRGSSNRIFRVHVPDGKEEKVLEVPFRLASPLFTLTPDRSPIVLREHGRYDLYSLALSIQ